MYIYHSRGVFLADYGWFEGNILYFNTQTRVYHILFIDGTNYIVAEDLDGIEILFYCNVSSALVHSVHSLLICVSSFDQLIWSFSHP